jgi:hypothetical protein
MTATVFACIGGLLAGIAIGLVLWSCLAMSKRCDNNERQ